ncbi:hypothetical protein GALL_362570 [mine drainage metagenome]|uniref:Uncharacterized protein n=1 Tax=mine drainage metagenome TaxID=410659 RepID=A0A1J5QQ12_9ZZZZ
MVPVRGGFVEICATSGHYVDMPLLVISVVVIAIVTVLLARRR